MLNLNIWVIDLIKQSEEIGVLQLSFFGFRGGPTNLINARGSFMWILSWMGERKFVQAV